jgi:hypothetical protein
VNEETPRDILLQLMGHFGHAVDADNKYGCEMRCGHCGEKVMPMEGHSQYCLFRRLEKMLPREHA